MTERTMDVLRRLPVRGKKQQLAAFRESIRAYAQELEYPVCMEDAGRGGANVVIGDPKGAKYLLTAHWELSALGTFLEILRSVPLIHRGRVCFVLFSAPGQGPSAYRKCHREALEKQIVLHLGSVGIGDKIVFYPNRRLVKDRRKLNPIYTCCGQFGSRQVSIREKGRSWALSCGRRFPLGMDIYAFPGNRREYWKSRFRKNGTIPLEPTNINILRAAICTLISCDAMQ